MEESLVVVIAIVDRNWLSDHLRAFDRSSIVCFSVRNFDDDLTIFGTALSGTEPASRKAMRSVEEFG